MDPDFIITDSSGRCKCCLGDSELRNIWEQHEFEGESENYGEMLNECFGISWEPSETTDLICEVCVSRLRDAMDFKLEILTTQDMLQEGVYISIKSEVDEDAASQVEEQETVEWIEDSEWKELEGTPSDSQASPGEPRKRKYPPKLPKSCRNRTYKQYTMSELRDAVRSVWDGERTCAEAAQEYGIPKATLLRKITAKTRTGRESTEHDDAKGLHNRKHFNLIQDIKKLLQYTNAIPYRTKGSRYHCFYCSTDGPFFEDADDLRSHTAEHCDERISSVERHMTPHWTNEVIKLDVKDLHCTECRTALPDWNGVFAHLAETHSVGFDEAYARVIPYALSERFACALCKESFLNYGSLDAHMNLHYSNHICHECGDTFLAAARLDKHLTTHRVGRYPCEQCDKVFTHDRYRAKHVSLVHEQARKAKCLYCDEKFVDPFARHRHVTEAHPDKVKPITCEVCGKVFTWKPYYHAHVRKRHRGVRTHKCAHCPKAFLMPHELKSHAVRHTGEKSFVCVCGVSFSRAFALRKHVQLVHGGEDVVQNYDLGV